VLAKIKCNGPATRFQNYKYALALKGTIFWLLMAIVIFWLVQNGTILYPTDLYICLIIFGFWIGILINAFYRLENLALANAKANRTSNLENLNEIDQVGWRQKTTETEHFYSWKSLTTFAEIPSHFIVKPTLVETW
jgi:hypothetical protein